ncbi:hypothetical protein [Pseudomonas lactucae]|uniref:hypothetical protein n=1 Tax=Pseudomonas lactucae TaxID=2813360 RepID=UPI002FCD40DD
MILNLNLSRQGTHRAENRDFSGSAHNSGAQLYVITDGASKSGSGELAKAMTQYLLESFAHAAATEVPCLEKALRLTLTSLNEVSFQPLKTVELPMPRSRSVSQPIGR